MPRTKGDRMRGGEKERKKTKRRPHSHQASMSSDHSKQEEVKTCAIERESPQNPGKTSSEEPPTTTLKSVPHRDFKVELDIDPSLLVVEQSHHIDFKGQEESDTDPTLSHPTSLSSSGEASQDLCVQIKKEPGADDFNNGFLRKGKDIPQDVKTDAHHDAQSEMVFDVQYKIHMMKGSEEDTGEDEHMTQGNREDGNIQSLHHDSGLEYSEDRTNESDSELPVHFQEKEQDDMEDKLYECGTCHLAFSIASDLYQHVSQHDTDEKEFCCGVCQNVFSDFPLLTQHVFIHIRTGQGDLSIIKEKPRKSRSYICDVCHKVFYRACDLSRHKKIHSDNKPFVCDICAKVFCRQDNMNRHRKIHTGERPFQCDECQKIFLTVGDLNQHKKVHSRHQPFVCEVCSKGFFRYDKFDRHRMMHTGLRPFTCDVCGKTFITIADLLTHKKYHSGYRPFVCDVCPKAFYRINDLNRHKTIHDANRKTRPYRRTGMDIPKVQATNCEPKETTSETDPSLSQSDKEADSHNNINNS